MATLHEDQDPLNPIPSGVTAQTLFDALKTGVDITLPTVDLEGSEFQIPNLGDFSTAVTSLTEADLTERKVDGKGLFDGLMQALGAHIQREFSKGRLTGAQYAEAYIALTTAALGSAVQYLLQKDQARWQSALLYQQAQLASVEVIKARVALEEAKVRLGIAKVDAEMGLANYALTKMKLATENVNYELTHTQLHIQEYTLKELMPIQKLGLEKDNLLKDAQVLDVQAGTSLKTAQEAQVSYETNNLMPAQLGQTTAQTAQITYTTSNMLPAQKAGIEADTLVKGVQKLNIEADTTNKGAQKLNIDKDTEQKTAQVAQLTYQTANLLPAQKLDIEAGISVKEAQEGQILYETASILPAQRNKLVEETAVLAYQLSSLYPAQVAGITADTVGKVYTNTNILPAQLLSLKEQTEAHRAKTLNTRSDGAPVAGAMGVQKELYETQIFSYKRDGEYKYAKTLVDTWITQKSLDEGLTPPTSLNDAAINSALTALKTNLEL